MLKALVTFVMNHQALSAAVGTWLLGNICAAIPTPTSNSGKFYQFFFNFATLVGSALPRSVPSLRIPQGQQIPGQPLTNK